MAAWLGAEDPGISALPIEPEHRECPHQGSYPFEGKRKSTSSKIRHAFVLQTGLSRNSSGRSVIMAEHRVESRGWSVWRK